MFIVLSHSFEVEVGFIAVAVLTRSALQLPEKIGSLHRKHERATTLPRLSIHVERVSGGYIETNNSQSHTWSNPKSKFFASNTSLPQPSRVKYCHRIN